MLILRLPPIMEHCRADVPIETRSGNGDNYGPWNSSFSSWRADSDYHSSCVVMALTAQE
jgi:hypothetical protein